MRALITIGKALDLLNISSQGSNYGLARFFVERFKFGRAYSFGLCDRHHGRFAARMNQNFRNLARRHFCALCRFSGWLLRLYRKHDGSSFSS